MIVRQVKKVSQRMLLQVEICGSQLKRQKPILEFEQIKILLKQLPELSFH